MKSDITISDFMYRERAVIESAWQLVGDNLAKHHVTTVQGHARIVDAHTVEVSRYRETVQRLTADVILIATGSHPVRPANIPFDSETVVDSDSLLTLPAIPPRHGRRRRRSDRLRIRRNVRRTRRARDAHQRARTSADPARRRSERCTLRGDDAPARDTGDAQRRGARDSRRSRRKPRRDRRADRRHRTRGRLRALQHRTVGRDGRPRPRRGWRPHEQPRVHPRRRELPHDRAEHLRRRRRDRLSGARVNVDGAGARRDVPCVRPPLQGARVARAPIRRVDRARGRDGWRDRGDRARQGTLVRDRQGDASARTCAARSSATSTGS